ncbi:MAG: spermidine/putrescine ABC transporter permease [Paracoccaceae bacterium]|nr:MAG: spermidine/putrescine ABC transporter permease [Paracoccaceae bacterium]
MHHLKFLRGGLAVYTALFIAFLYGPFVVMGILSFQKGPEGGPQFPILEWSTYWYRHVLGLAPPSRVAPLPIGEALVRSLTLAFATMVVSTVLGTLTAQAFRERFRGSGLVFYLVVLGMIVPGVLLGLGMALLANNLGIDRNWWSTAFVLHVVYTYPFAFLVMLAIFNRFDRSVEEASWMLGVTPARTFRKVTFPMIFPGVLSAMLFAFTLSYDEFPRTLFTAGSDVTMPIAIYGTFAVEIHPNLFAFGVLTTLFSFALLSVYGILMALSVRRARMRATGIQEEIA